MRLEDPSLMATSPTTLVMSQQISLVQVPVRGEGAEGGACKQVCEGKLAGQDARAGVGGARQISLVRGGRVHGAGNVGEVSTVCRHQAGTWRAACLGKRE